MGRGRAKAKQAKVARQLKYHTPDTDLGALERELSGNDARDDDYDDPYDAYKPRSGTDEPEPREEDWLPRKH
ncbi:DUF3073 domain-containing protein [Stackebrandtia nassauensis]|uniref:DUF3073 domain-containing protein n=1 Tax=Stackebrandtia nassauensis (strain DSM 44728 / CIP 108903 / NRRL B-16338 / NBRC 102104 / LLR-40K-21) TaxID=446470 RepID=D3Q079_STANL|nr:DUF3073 domain-containing protein [Stackebrandtia nassauensis]ADD45608.1 hypothetical protein Snas_5982 [Stackebrandtia nassauensis DSM 44728]